MNRLLTTILTIILIAITVISCGPADSAPGTEDDATFNWIKPGKVKIENFYPGARAEYPVTIHNGNDHAAKFSVEYRYPDNLDPSEGYVLPSYSAVEWVLIADDDPVLEPLETREVLITLEMPENVQNNHPKWEFWIAIKDQSQNTMVQTELCSRWLITMKD